MQIRPYRPSDRAAVYDVCVRTADTGGDARGMCDSDALMGDIFAGPYVDLEPEQCFVADDGERAVGYIVGTADTAAFVRRYRAEWIPALAHAYPHVERPARTATERMLLLHQEPERILHPELAAYPAHLHIDLLPEAQRSGLGRALMRAFLSRLAERGVDGVHLGMVRSNEPAARFYERLGFEEVEIPDEPESRTFVRSTRRPVD